MWDLMNTPLFAVMISVVTFQFGSYIYNKTKIPFLNPLLISQTLIILFLIKFHISFDSYNKGGQYISFFLGPATVVLAVPLYKKIKLLKQNFIPIMGGIIVGSVFGMVSVILMGKIFGLDKSIMHSLIPKSITTPIGVEVSKQMGGVPSITVVAIILTGIIGSIIAPTITRLFKIKDKVAVGIAIGTSSHAIGTTKALELGETEGAMSGVSIGIAGIVTIFLAPIIARVLGYF